MSSFIPKIVYDSPEKTVQFEYIPEGDPINNAIRTNQVTTKSSLGNTQTQFNYNEIVYRVTYTFVSSSILDDYEDFYLDWASKGKEFKYFFSSDEPEFILVTLDRFEFDPERLFSENTPGNFVYKFSISFRKVA